MKKSKIIIIVIVAIIIIAVIIFVKCKYDNDFNKGIDNKFIGIVIEVIDNRYNSNA